MSRAYHGPVLVPTRDEVVRIYDAMRFVDDAQAKSIVAKCEAVLNADPKWRKPLK